MRGFIAAIILGCFAGVWEISIRTLLPGWAAFSPILPLSIILLVTDTRVSRSLVCVCIGALFLDIFSVSHGDLALVRYVALILLLDVVAHHWLTNRSLYASLGLVIGGRLLERVSGWMVEHIVSWLTNRPIFWTGWNHLGWIIFWDLVCVGIGFTLVVSFSRRFAGIVRTSDSGRLYE